MAEQKKLVRKPPSSGPMAKDQIQRTLVPQNPPTAPAPHPFSCGPGQADLRGTHWPWTESPAGAPPPALGAACTSPPAPGLLSPIPGPQYPSPLNCVLLQDAWQRCPWALISSWNLVVRRCSWDQSFLFFRALFARLNLSFRWRE